MKQSAIKQSKQNNDIIYIRWRLDITYIDLLCLVLSASVGGEFLKTTTAITNIYYSLFYLVIKSHIDLGWGRRKWNKVKYSERLECGVWSE